MTFEQITKAVLEIPADKNIGCVDCGKLAIVWWPVTNFNRQEPYCKNCLEQAQFRLAVAMGIASN